jgi:hypothetical protein
MTSSEKNISMYMIYRYNGNGVDPKIVVKFMTVFVAWRDLAYS